jgi:CRP/FNR family cyclic AMP-dependent transcriptional regulator
MNKSDKQRVNIFEELESSEVELLLEKASVENMGRREVLFLPGDNRSSVYIVLKGLVKLARLSEDGREIIVDIAEEGEMFGEMAIINPGEHETMAEMMSHSEIAIIPASAFQNAVQETPKLAFLLARVVGVRRINIESRLEDLAFRNVPARLAKFLMEQAENTGTRNGEQINVPAHYSQQEIGSLIGSTRETTSHFLNDFRRSGIIDFDKKFINILDSDKLAEMGGFYG